MNKMISMTFLPFPVTLFKPFVKGFHRKMGRYR